jgi:hypothetical protein
MSWARLQVRAICGLRWGAWYPVTGLTARDAQVQVRGRPVVVSRALLELRTTPSQQWTVVAPGVDPKRPLAGVRDGYVVCPGCRHRETTPELRVPTLRCPRCNGAFSIAWHEPYPRAEADGRASYLRSGALASDNRKTRRRPQTERRVRFERRSAERRMRLTAVTSSERRHTQRRTRARRTGVERRSGIERRHKSARR